MFERRPGGHADLYGAIVSLGVTARSTGWHGLEPAPTHDMNELEAEMRLLALETMLELAPHETLGIGRGEGVITASVAFATAATRYHPRWFVGLSSATVNRATLAFARLRAAYHAYITGFADRRWPSRPRSDHAPRRFPFPSHPINEVTASWKSLVA